MNQFRLTNFDSNYNYKDYVNTIDDDYIDSIEVALKWLWKQPIHDDN